MGALNVEARRWMEQTANVRLHRATTRRPCDLFAEEKPRLQTLPCLGYDITKSHRVRATNRCQVNFESNRYSVPFACAGALLELRADPDTVCLYRREELVARHPRNYGRNVDIDNPDHTNRLLKERRRGEDSALLARFLALTPKAEAYYEALSLRTLCALRQVRRILLLAETYGRDRTGAALEEALELGAYGSDYLRNILEYRQALEPVAGQLHLTWGQEHLGIEIPRSDCSRFSSSNPRDSAL